MQFHTSKHLSRKSGKKSKENSLWNLGYDCFIFTSCNKTLKYNSQLTSAALPKAFRAAVKLPRCRYASARHSHTCLFVDKAKTTNMKASERHHTEGKWKRKKNPHHIIYSCVHSSPIPTVFTVSVSSIKPSVVPSCRKLKFWWVKIFTTMLPADCWHIRNPCV